MRERILAVVVLFLCLAGCKATVSFMVQKDWALESDNILTPDAKSSVNLSFTDDHFLDRDHKRRETLRAQLDAAKARQELSKLRQEEQKGQGKK